MLDLPNTPLLPSALLVSFARNMEDTLAARDKLESVRAARRNAPGASSSLEGSLTANYSHHQKEWALQIRALQNRQVRNSRGRKSIFMRVVVALF